MGVFGGVYQGMSKRSIDQILDGPPPAPLPPWKQPEVELLFDALREARAVLKHIYTSPGDDWEEMTMQANDLLEKWGEHE